MLMQRTIVASVALPHGRASDTASSPRLLYCALSALKNGEPSLTVGLVPRFIAAKLLPDHAPILFQPHHFVAFFALESGGELRHV